jgi:hypothetical protein
LMCSLVLKYFEFVYNPIFSIIAYVFGIIYKEIYLLL